MSILSKLQSLLTAANATTGESDTTLTDAIQTLVDGYGQGGGVESGTYTPTERTMSHTFTTQSEKNNFIVFADNGFDFTLGDASMIVAVYGRYIVTTNNSGTTVSLATNNQATLTKSGNNYTYTAVGELSSTSRCLQANVTYVWFAW